MVYENIYFKFVGAVGGKNKIKNTEFFICAVINV